MLEFTMLNKEKIYINKSYIQCIKPYLDGTKIILINSETLIKESLDEVLEMLTDDE